MSVTRQTGSRTSPVCCRCRSTQTKTVIDRAWEAASLEMAIAVWAMARRRLAPAALGRWDLAGCTNLLLPLLHIGEEGTRIFNMRHIVAAVRDGDFSGKLPVGRHPRSSESAHGFQTREADGSRCRGSAPNSPRLRQVPREQARGITRRLLHIARIARVRTRDAVSHRVDLPGSCRVRSPMSAITSRPNWSDEQLLIVRNPPTPSACCPTSAATAAVPVAQGRRSRGAIRVRLSRLDLRARWPVARRAADPGRPHFTKAACRLPQFASEIWQGYIFVNLDGPAAPLAPALSPTEPLSGTTIRPTSIFCSKHRKCGIRIGSAWSRTSWRAIT